MPTRVTRRQFGVLAGGALASAAFGNACRGSLQPRDGNDAIDGRLTVRPRPAQSTTARETRALELDATRDAILKIPANAGADPLPLVVLLHGAGGSGERLLQRFGSTPDTAGVAVLAPDSRGSTWDAIRGGYGPDVTFINRALERVFETTSIDPARVAVGGFSDGATYAIAIGLINGDLFRRILAFSPGFVIDGPPHGQPTFFISHGKADEILPINRCSRVIVPALRQHGYDVTYREFEGGHEVPGGVADEGFKWVAKVSATVAAPATSYR